MEYRQLIGSQKIPALGLGTARIGGLLKPDYVHDAQYIEAMGYAITKGITHIDTAERYGLGHAEEIIGQAIKPFDRQKLFITSKVSPYHLTYRGVPAACERSLERLKTDYIDLYLIHWPNPLARMKRVMQAFDGLVAAGKIRFIGVSNFSIEQIEGAQNYTKNKLVTNQVEYNLFNQEARKSLLPYCQKNRIILTAYSPLAQGSLIINPPKLLQEIAKAYGKTPVQVALRWLIDQPNVITIPKAAKKAHINEILGSLSWHLRQADRERLNRVAV